MEPKEPIGSLLSGNRLKLATLQDYVVELIYNHIDPSALLYGGTAIWRCYGGNRFSEDIDIYMKNSSLEKLVGLLPKYGLKLSWRDKELPTNIRISDGETSLLLEAKEGHAESTIAQYARVDGTSMTIGVLSPTELLIRKMEAYEGRRLIRDVYDIFILTKALDKNDYTVASKLSSFIGGIKEPVDEKLLRSLIYTGSSGISYAKIIEYIRRWLHQV